MKYIPPTLVKDVLQEVLSLMERMMCGVEILWDSYHSY